MAKKMVLANEAVAYAFLRAGVKVVSGYPGTPSSEVIGSLLKMKDLDGTKAVDKEILSPHAGLKNPIDITVEGTGEEYRQVLEKTLTEYDAALALYIGTPYLKAMPVAEGIKKSG